MLLCTIVKINKIYLAARDDPLARIGHDPIQIFAPGMRPKMSGDHISPACSVGALRASVRLLPGVRPLMSAQVIRAGKHLAADPTGVWFETSVKPHVTGQHVGAGKRPLAHLALVALDDHSARISSAGDCRTRSSWLLLLARLVTRSHVLDESVVQIKDLTAYLAAESGRIVLVVLFHSTIQLSSEVRVTLGCGEVVRERYAPRQSFESAR